jgi:hypothetical protein
MTSFQWISLLVTFTISYIYGFVLSIFFMSLFLSIGVEALAAVLLATGATFLVTLGTINPLMTVCENASTLAYSAYDNIRKGVKSLRKSPKKDNVFILNF